MTRRDSAFGIDLRHGSAQVVAPTGLPRRARLTGVPRFPAPEMVAQRLRLGTDLRLDVLTDGARVAGRQRRLHRRMQIGTIAAAARSSRKHGTLAVLIWRPIDARVHPRLEAIHIDHIERVAIDVRVRIERTDETER